MKGRKALYGVKIVDFTWFSVGPITTKYLADHGAIVVKVESHAKPDSGRYVSPSLGNVAGLEHSAAYANWNTSKYSIGLSLKTPKGIETVLRLIRWADIVTEGFTVGTMKKLGLDYESVKKVKPDIIYVSTSQHGQTGPFAKFAGWGYQGTGLAGMIDICGSPDSGPTPLSSPYTDYIAPKFLASAILAALDRRRRTGKGLYIDQSQIESSLQLIAPLIMDYAINGRIAGRHGNELSYAAPHGVYPCKGENRWVAITVLSDAQWEAFCSVTSDHAWIPNPKFNSVLERKENEEELDKMIGNWTKNHKAETIESKLQGVGVPASLVESNQDLFEDPQLKYRGHFREFEKSGLGLHSCEGPAFHLSKTPDTQFSSPALGQHNEYVFKELLGMSDQEIDDLVNEGVITTNGPITNNKVSVTGSVKAV